MSYFTEGLYYKTIDSDLSDQGIRITLKPEAKVYVPELLLTPSSDILHPLPQRNFKITNKRKEKWLKLELLHKRFIYQNH